MRRPVQLLVEMLYIKRNPDSWWSLPVFVVPKNTLHQIRRVVDTGYPNSCIHPSTGRFPILQAFPPYLKHAVGFASLDAFRGLEQLPVHEYSQNVYSIPSDMVPDRNKIRLHISIVDHCGLCGDISLEAMKTVSSLSYLRCWWRLEIHLLESPRSKYWYSSCDPS